MLEIQDRDDVATVQMLHGKVNALDGELCQALIRALSDLVENQSRALILRGNGRVFSAGIDLKRWLAEGPEYVLSYLELLERLFRDLLVFPKPVVVVVDGAAIAGGCILASTADFRLISPTARIGMPEMRIGVPLPMTAVEIIRMVTPMPTLARMLNWGATFVGQTAVDHGLADRVFPDDRLVPEAERAALELAVIPAATFRLTKAQIRGAVLRRINENIREHYDEFARIWTSSETRDVIESYVSERLH